VKDPIPYLDVTALPDQHAFMITLQVILNALVEAENERRCPKIILDLSDAPPTIH
jgi:hypothetical protein